MEKALLVTADFNRGSNGFDIEDAVSELKELVAACGVDGIESESCFCDRPTPNFLIGRGKAEELGLLAQELGVDAVIFNNDLSGTQQRNLEELWGKKTIDRTQLILDIFARRAKSPEGKMQVELAQLEYLMPRLVGKGIILSRQGGGVGTSGPGEKKLEIDRRRIRERIKKLKDDLKHVVTHRSLIRKNREERLVPLIAIVGYTSAGKSTLLNTLTKSTQPVSSDLFTTLDPIARNSRMPNGETVVFSDTVGFIRDLPHNLIEAFKATLEEVSNADLLLHVLDAASPKVYERYHSVIDVLRELKADQKPMITVLNKTDLLDDSIWLNEISKDFINSVNLSAKFGNNLDKLLEKIEAMLPENTVELDTILPHKRMDLVDLFYKKGSVKKVEYLQKGIKIKAKVPKTIYHKLLHDKVI